MGRRDRRIKSEEERVQLSRCSTWVRFVREGYVRKRQGKNQEENHDKVQKQAFCVKG